jgi:sugar-specific transcriptional regulator TrmB
MEEFKAWVSSKEFWQFIGALAIMVAAIWYNPKTIKQIENIKDGFKKTLDDIKSEFNNIKEDLKNIKAELKENTELTAMTRTRKETIDLLNSTVNNALEYIYDEKLREFLTIKTKSIIQFTLDIIELDLNSITDLQLHLKLTIEKERIRKIGYEILGQEFIDGFYDPIHSDSTEWYERDLLNILHCKINYKAEAIRARTEVFIRETIQGITYEYNEYKKKN